MPRGISVAIVGLGSRGLSVLERIVTLADKAGPAAGEVRVEVIDPACTGAGVHDPAQPDYLMLNTICSQLSMFPDLHTVGPGAQWPGPSLHQWANERGLLLAEDGFTVGDRGRPIRPTDFLPRRVLGEYLEWFLSEVRERVPAHVRLLLHRAAALDISAGPDDDLAVDLSDGSRVLARYAFLTTGYTGNGDPSAARHGQVIAEPYPLPERAAPVAPAQTVAISGFGLSAMDLVSCLTVGRGGRYVQDQGALRYVPSGAEPTLLLYSRSGLPCRARPLVTKFDVPHEPLVCTNAAIDALRAHLGGQLDFDRDVLPLIHAEMRIAYRLGQARQGGPGVEQGLLRDLADAVAADQLMILLDGLDTKLGRFDPAIALDCPARMLLSDADAYQGWLADHIHRDLAEGFLGFAKSPLKAALDVIRQLRDTVRYVVDYGGVTSHSLDEFYRRTVPMMNRAVVGPQYERHVELLALMAAGIARTPFGPSPTVTWDEGRRTWTIASTQLEVAHSGEADWLALAQVPQPAVESSASPLLSAMNRSGRIRRHRPECGYVHGIDITPDQHPVNALGQPEERIWVLGPLCEGSTFYNNQVPWPGVARPMFDAHRCVAAMFAAEGASAPPDSARHLPGTAQVHGAALAADALRSAAAERSPGSDQAVGGVATAVSHEAFLPFSPAMAARQFGFPERPR